MFCIQTDVLGCSSTIIRLSDNNPHLVTHFEVILLYCTAMCRCYSHCLFPGNQQTGAWGATFSGACGKCPSRSAAAWTYTLSRLFDFALVGLLIITTLGARAAWAGDGAGGGSGGGPGGRARAQACNSLCWLHGHDCRHVLASACKLHLSCVVQHEHAAVEACGVCLPDNNRDSKRCFFCILLECSPTRFDLNPLTQS